MLAVWAAGSTAVGAVLALRPATRGFGRQTAAWGLVDGAIAGVGVRGRRRKGPTDPARLRRLLLINAGLDVGYVAAGAWLVGHGRWRGDGWAVVLQGGFLLALDAVSARRLCPECGRGPAGRRSGPAGRRHRRAGQGAAMTDKTLDDALDGLRFAMVATADADGTWKSRPLALAGQAGSVVSFLVSTDAEWVASLETGGSPTTVTFSDPGKNTYVALQGSARTVDDRARIAELWNVGAESWFESKDDPVLRVLDVQVHYGEFWDGPSGMVGRAVQLASAALGRPTGSQGDVVT